jgi:hypothetical protein
MKGMAILLRALVSVDASGPAAGLKRSCDAMTIGPTDYDFGLIG